MNIIKPYTLFLFFNLLLGGLHAQGVMFDKQLNYDSLRIKWADFLTGGHYNLNEPEIKARLKIIEKNASSSVNSGSWRDTVNRKSIWADLRYDKSADITTSYTRLFSMALAYSSPGTRWYHDQQLKKDILSALQWLYIHHYNERTTVPVTGGTNNWWDYRIGTPEKLNQIMLLMYADIVPAWRDSYLRAIRHSTPDVGSYTGANLVWISKIIALSSILSNNPNSLSYAINALRPVFDYVNQGDGFYTDGSFIQHNRHPYNGGYGVALISSLAELMYLFPAINATMPSSAHIYSWIYNSYEPLIYRGAMMSNVMGREISRYAMNEHIKARQLVEGLILLARQAPQKEATRLNALIKSYIQESPNGIAYSTITLTSMARAIMVDQSIIPPVNYKAYRLMANMDRAVQQAVNYAFTVSMHSARIYNFESINQENLKGWHLSDGMTYLYNADSSQFEDNFWNTIDYQHLPGTTTEENSTAPGNKTSNKNWVGGTGLLDKYGICGMDLAPFASTLAAKKSWFMLDSQIVCLGAGIANQDDKTIFTTIEQRKLSVDNTNIFTVDGVVMPPYFNVQRKAGIRWAQLSGNVKAADIGYYFPDEVVLNMQRKSQSGRWSDLRTGSDSTVYSRNFLTLWKEHGTYLIDLNGIENKYSYVLLPGFTADQVKTYAKRPSIQILSNTASVQSVKDIKLGLTGANFWKDTISMVSVNSKPYLTCDKKAAVMVLDKDGSLTIALADPTMLNEGSIQIQIESPVSGLITSDGEVSVQQLKPALKFSVNVKNLKGRTVTVVFNKK